MTTEERHPEWAIDPNVPSVARMYDYYLGGKDNFAADREAAEKALAVVPYVREFTRANRRFLSRAVTWLAERGIRQFLDIGSGLPTQENVHQVAQRVAPDSRVVYVDNDPIVLAHGRALLAGDSSTTVIQADLRDPEDILSRPEVGALIDFERPVAVLLLAILHFIPDDAQPMQIVRRLRKQLVPGSFLVISHGHAGKMPADVAARARSAYGQTKAGDLIPRTPEQIRCFFEGTDLVGPGLVPVERWTPDAEPFEPDLTKVGFLSGVGRVR